MTFEQAFNKIKEKFVDADASKVEDFAMQITLTDEDCGGTLYAAVKDGVLAVEPYDYRDNTSVLDITKSALLAVLSGRVSLNKAIENNEASMSGEVSNMAALKSTIKKAPAAKAETKEAAPKAAAKTETEAAAPKAAAKTETKAAAPKAAVKTETEAAAPKAAVKTETKEAPKAAAKAETKEADPKTAKKPAALKKKSK